MRLLFPLYCIVRSDANIFGDYSFSFCHVRFIESACVYILLFVVLNLDIKTYIRFKSTKNLIQIFTHQITQLRENFKLLFLPHNKFFKSKSTTSPSN